MRKIVLTIEATRTLDEREWSDFKEMIRAVPQGEGLDLDALEREGETVHTSRLPDGRPMITRYTIRRA